MIYSYSISNRSKTKQVRTSFRNSKRWKQNCQRLKTEILKLWSAFSTKNYRNGKAALLSWQHICFQIQRTTVFVSFYICLNKHIDSDHSCFIYLSRFTSPARPILGESILCYISITVQTCAKDLYKSSLEYMTGKHFDWRVRVSKPWFEGLYLKAGFTRGHFNAGSSIKSAHNSAEKSS